MEGGSADTFFLLKWKSAAISFFKHTWSGWWYQSSLNTFWVGGGALGQPSFNLNCLIESNVRGGLEKLARPVDKSMSQLPGQVMAYLQHTRPFIPQQCVHTSRKDSLQLFFVVVVVFSSLSQTQDKEKKKKKKFWKETVHAASCAVFCFVSLFFFYFHFPPSSTSILLRELLYFGQPSPSAASRGGQWRRPAAVPGMSSGTLLVVFFLFFFWLFLSSKRERKIDPLWLSLSSVFGPSLEYQIECHTRAWRILDDRRFHMSHTAVRGAMDSRHNQVFFCNLHGDNQIVCCSPCPVHQLLYQKAHGQQ